MLSVNDGDSTYVKPDAFQAKAILSMALEAVCDYSEATGLDEPPKAGRLCMKLQLAWHADLGGQVYEVVEEAVATSRQNRSNRRRMIHVLPSSASRSI